MVFMKWLGRRKNKKDERKSAGWRLLEIERGIGRLNEAGTERLSEDKIRLMKRFIMVYENAGERFRNISGYEKTYREYRERIKRDEAGRQNS